MQTLNLLSAHACGLAITSAIATHPQHQPNNPNEPSLRVDLGYEVYEGYRDSQSQLSTWKGIRFAAPPVGTLRWQAPQRPLENRDRTVNASTFGAQCPQNQLGGFEHVPTAPGSEDCLFLNVYSPPNAKDLPVLVWIHGGGYGLGNGQQDVSKMIATSNNSFVAVVIQYRLGAFGFLSSDEVFRKGVVNAGLLDQHFALQWVQSHIAQFGGDSSRVTTMAYGGTLGESLFANAIAASPFLPKQYGYSDMIPSQSYYAFAAQAGCMPGTAYGRSTSIFECLVSQNTSTLQAVSASISSSSVFGTWAFLPVTDGSFVQDLPGRQLLESRVNGRNIMVGNNALEGPLFTPQNITTEEDLLKWEQQLLPYANSRVVTQTLEHYPGDLPQHRADELTAEMTFVCPSHWLAESFSGGDGSAYKYQYSVSPATHASDVSAYFGPSAVQQGPDFVQAFTTLGRATSNTTTTNTTNDSSSATTWPTYSATLPMQVNLNQSGGVEFSSALAVPGINLTGYADPGLRNDFTLDNAYETANGRGRCCDFLRSLGVVVPT